MHISEQDLKKVLLESGIVSEKQFDEAKLESSHSGADIGRVLLGKNIITEQFLSEILAEFFDVEAVNLSKMRVDRKFLDLLPESFSKSKGVVVFDLDEEKKTAKLAMEDPADLETIGIVASKLNMDVVPCLATHSGIKSVFKEFKKDIRTEFSNIIETSIKGALSSGADKDNLAKMAEFVPIVKIVDSIVEYAVVAGASDIHIERGEEEVLVRYRIDGVLKDITTLPKELHDALIARVKILSALQIDIRHTPQDGRFRFDMEEEKVDIRVSVMPTFYGEKVVMRILKGAATPLSFADLGMSADVVKKVERSLKRTFGMLLITGPTGSGKTTTLYSMLHILNTPNVSIATIEDPIEYDVQRINQTQVNAKAGITFANGLRSLMRQNPDIIMVGEIRDNETVEIALNASMTGHLVLSTLHTNDAPTAVPRLIDMGGEPFLIASTVSIVIAQRLARKICSHCISSFAPSEELKKSIESQLLIRGQKNPVVPKEVYIGKGCNLCNFTGYHGQIGIYEVMEITPKIKELINGKVSADVVRNVAREEGMVSMFEDGLLKVERGVTTVEEIMRVTAE
ncbi:type II/IV secretion system protein [Candidatus Azambacteria bacterium]|nr:type II/IV secretion system protein [Candidatus Azambacteria bacterium]